MQSADAKLSRSSLLLSLKRYSAVVRDMEQTVLIPSLLREVPADDITSTTTASTISASDDSKDLYDYYLMLKAIRNTVDNGLVTLNDDTKVKGHGALDKSLEPLLDSDLEAVFHFHLQGLFRVMGHLTTGSRCLTARYMDLIGLSY